MSGPPREDASDEAAFLRAVEERFRALRGRPLLLSPADTKQAIAWHADGLPLDVVLETLDALYARAAEAGRRGPRSLRYCDEAVRDAARRSAELALGGARHTAGEPAADPHARARAYERAAAELRRSSAPEGARERAAVRLDALAAGGTAAGEADPLLEIEDALVAACLAGLADEERAALESEARAAIGPWATRMTDEVRARAERRAVARVVRGRFALPDLSRLPLPRAGES